MGAAVFCTYFFVAHPLASNAPVTMQVVARKAFMSLYLTGDTCNPDANPAKLSFFNAMRTRPSICRAPIM
jgi:hypothetical protein